MSDRPYTAIFTGTRIGVFTKDEDPEQYVRHLPKGIGLWAHYENLYLAVKGFQEAVKDGKVEIVTDAGHTRIWLNMDDLPSFIVHNHHSCGMLLRKLKDEAAEELLAQLQEDEEGEIDQEGDAEDNQEGDREENQEGSGPP